MSRKCKNWLTTLRDYVEETESPRNFWLWSGLYCLTSALQRKVWLDYGIGPIYPNLYIMIIAPPGRCRKGAPVGFAAKILPEIQVSKFSDSATRRSISKGLAEASKGQYFINPVTQANIFHSSMAFISKELSSFLSVDPKGVIEILTDIYDCHDEWEHKTSGEGKDTLYNLCPSCFLASTPTWIMANLPEESIGGGFTSRFIVVSGTEKYKYVAIPPPLDEQMYANLRADLAHIKHKLVGQFNWTEGAKQLFTEWYNTIPKRIAATNDERMHGYLERIHIMVIKTAMGLRVAYSDELLLTTDDMQAAITLLDNILIDAPAAFGGQGRNRLSIDLDRVSHQIKMMGSAGVKMTDLLRANIRHVTRAELEEIVDSLAFTGKVRIESGPEESGYKQKVYWVKERNRKE